jgi:RNA polymerase sigma-70 factor, ECF subfamily
LKAHEYAQTLEPLLEQAAGYARTMLRNTQDAEDAVQDAALRGWRRIETFDSRRPFKGWWFAILRNCCIDALRRAKTRATENLEGLDPPQSRNSSELEWIDLVTAIGRVSEAHREILRLRYFADLSYAELAETLGAPLGTVSTRLHLARKALAAQMRKDER